MKKTISIALTLIGLAAATPALGAYIIYFEEAGGNVVATGSGSLDLTGLMGAFPSTGTPAVHPNFPSVLLGPPPSGMIDIYNGGAGPISWGTGPSTAADAGSGNLVGASYDLSVGLVFVPQGYVSGTDLGTSTATWTGASFASLGLAPGSYVSTWGADSFTVNVNPIPEPATWALLLLGFGAIGGVLRARRHGRTNARLTA